MKKIHLFTLGGTIAYLGKENNEQNTLTGDELIDSIPEIKNDVHLKVIPFLHTASSSLTMQNIIDLAEAIQRTIHEGTDGIVITQGTDTIEESAFMLDLLIGHKVPIVVTGAMRNPSLPGAEGPANLFASIKVAASSKANDLGTLVVLNDEIHAARFVQKRHTQNVAAFESDYGRIGWVSEGKPRFIAQLTHDYPEAIQTLEINNINPSVALIACAMDNDDKIIRELINLGYDAVVIESLGGGHVPDALVDPLIQLAQKIPVVLSSRINKGEILANTYRGYKGSETYLLQNGLMSAGWLDSRKTRILLYLLLKSGKNMADIKEVFEFFSE